MATDKPKKDDGHVRASVLLDRRAWETTRAAAQLMNVDLESWIHDALERQLRAHQLPIADFWAEINTEEEGA